jgi:hypothetical protein
MRTPPERQATNIQREFRGATGLGDLRLENRLVALAERIRATPAESFPELSGSEAELTALYRFLNNKSVSAEVIMEPHKKQTALRCAEAGSVFVIHDTSEVEFAGVAKRKGLGRLRGESSQGFLLHAALAVAADGSGRPLGVLGAQTWVRGAAGTSRHEDGRKKCGGAYADETQKESNRWWKLIDETENRLGGVKAIHLFDREGDAYVLLRTALDNEARFITRMARDRVVLDENGDRIGRASELLIDVVDAFTLEVPLTARAAKPTPRSTEQPREARLARIAVGATKMLLAPPNYIDGTPESLEVNVVYVHEIDVPDGADPVSWVLITSEPIDTAAQIRAIVDAYRTRWLIEEFFKALKTGCALEKRQLESFTSIQAALAIFLPIAWQLLLLRSLARTSPDEPAELVLTNTQVDVLRAAVPSASLPPRPSVAQALYAVAYLGGHYRGRGPGWLVLGRGLEKLLDLETGWRLAVRLGKSDRS